MPDEPFIAVVISFMSAVITCTLLPHSTQQVAGIVVTDIRQLEQLFAPVLGEQCCGGGRAEGNFFLFEQAAQTKTHWVSPYHFAGANLIHLFEGTGYYRLIIMVVWSKLHST
jgi:hypothetical protein